MTLHILIIAEIHEKSIVNGAQVMIIFHYAMRTL